MISTEDAPAIGDMPSLNNRRAEKLKLFRLQMALKNTDNYLPGNPLNGIQFEHNGHYRDYKVNIGTLAKLLQNALRPNGKGRYQVSGESILLV